MERKRDNCVQSLVPHTFWLQIAKEKMNAHSKFSRLNFAKTSECFTVYWSKNKSEPMKYKLAPRNQADQNVNRYDDRYR